MSEQLQTTNDGVRLPFDAVKKLLQPLLEVADCDRMSLAHFTQNVQAVIQKMGQTERPVLLEGRDYLLLLCDPRKFFELESQRRRILSGCNSIMATPRAGRLGMPDVRVRELARLNKANEGMKAKVLDLEWQRKETERNLADGVAKAAKLQQDLEQSPPQ